jgi:glycosyltransferase involved in cell wall biosynthesis
VSLLSVIIPNRNRGRLLTRLFDPVREFCGQNPRWAAEIIVVDDASTDDSVAALREQAAGYPLPIMVLPHASPKGAAASRNDGIRAAKGEFLLFADSDAEFDADCLKKLADEIGDADVTFPKVIRANGEVISPITDYEEKYCMNSMLFLARRGALDCMGHWFDEFMQIYGEDSDFFMRAQALGVRIRYVPSAVAYHPVRDTFSEIAFYQGTKNGIYIILKLGGIVKYRIPFSLYLPYHLAVNLLIGVTKLHFHKLRPCGIHYTATRRRLLLMYFKALAAVAGQFGNLLRLRRDLKSRLRARAA